MSSINPFRNFILNRGAGYGQNLGWLATKQAIRIKFPHVKHISTNSLASWLDQTKVKQPLLLDTRTEPEYAVSHLPDAQLVAPDTQNFAFLDSLALDAPIITYCSVGYRSSMMAERLQEAGYTNVTNLEGSIFQWANEGRPVYRNSQIVQQVHPYNQLWGYLLDRWHAYEPTE
jgi:rhodanese-related sulfurtransferase